VIFFKPAGIRVRDIEEIGLALDELEALRLADVEGLYQEAAAQSMGVSRPTFSRIIAEARRKVAVALIRGKALRLEGGTVQLQKVDRACSAESGVSPEAGAHRGRHGRKLQGSLRWSRGGRRVFPPPDPAEEDPSRND